MVNTIENSGMMQAATLKSPASGRDGDISVASGGQAARAEVPAKATAQPPRTQATENSPSVNVAANFTSIQTRKEQSNETAQAVRQLETVRSNVDSMRSNLNQIVKMYPPYPKDSPQRVQLLNEMVGLRKLTDQLTIPPAYETMVSKVNEVPAVVDIYSSDAEVSAALASLDKTSADIAMAVKALNPQIEIGGGVGAALASEQQSRQVGKSLLSVPAGISGDAGKSLAITLTQ